MARSIKLYSVFAGLLLFSSSLSWAGNVKSVDDWTGIYVGGNLGWAGASSRTRTVTSYDTNKYFNVKSDEEDVEELGNQHLTSNNFTGGGQIGCNYQIGPMVLGLETDFNSLRTDKSITRSKRYVSAPTATLTVESSTQTSWLWTVRPRIGCAIDRLLIYGTGGLTLSDLEADFYLSDDYAAVLGDAAEHQKIRRVKAGWTAGGGLEVRLDKNWSIRGEYLYANLGTLRGEATDLFTTGNYGSNTFYHKAEFVMHMIRCGINYKF